MLNFQLSPTLTAFAQERSRWRLVLGPIGSGKTSGVFLTLLYQTLEQPVFNGKRLSRTMVIRNTRAQLKDSVIKTMQAITPPDNINVIFREAELSMTVKMISPDGVPAEAHFMFRSLEDESDIQRLLSVELTWVWMSEFSEIDFKIATPAASRCGRYPSKAMGGCTHFGLVGESNFPVKDSPWYNFLEVDTPANVSVFKQPSALTAEAENIENLPPGYYEDLIEGADPRWIQSYLSCEYPDSLLGKAVHPTFSKAKHAGKNLRPIIIGPDSPPIVIGMDAGRNPAAIFGQVQGDGRLNVLDELYESNMAMDEFVTRHVIPLVGRRFPGLKCVVVLDPAGFAQGQATDLSPAKVLMHKGFTTVPAPTNNIDPRLEAVDNLLAADGGILIDIEQCPSLVLALMRDYLFEQNRNGKLKEVPTKAHPVSDLCFAAGTQVGTPDGCTPIEKLRVGDFVTTPIGPRRVVAAACTNENAQTVEYLFSDGTRLVATPEHKIYTTRGLVPLDTLQYSDILLNQQKTAVRLVGKRLLVERRPVYDITVDDAHCYFAEGLLVSNCDALQYLALYTTSGYAPRIGRMLRKERETARVQIPSAAWT